MIKFYAIQLLHDIVFYADDLQDCGVHTFTDTYKASITDPNYFFGKMGQKILKWMKPFEKAYGCRTEGNSVKLEWFTKGKLNVSGKYVLQYILLCILKAD